MNKKGIELEMLLKMLVAIGILVVVSIFILYLRGRSKVAVDII